MLRGLRNFGSQLASAFAAGKAGKFSMRSFEAASGKRFENWRSANFGSINSEVNAAAPMVRGRARHFAENNAHAANGVGAFVTSLIGPGVVPVSQHPSRTVRRAIMAAFKRWVARCDADGRTDFYGIQAAAVRGMIVDGEAFIQLIQTDLGLKLRLIPPELVDSSHTVELGDGRRIIAGIEFSSDDRAIAYWVRPARANDVFQSYGTPIRIPAEDMIHMFVSHGPGQVRGISWLAPVLLRLGELDQLEDALLVGVKVAALHAGFLIDQNGTGSVPYDGTQTGSILESGLEPGTLKILPHGFDVKFNTPQQAQQSIELVQHQLRAIAAGLGVPSHLLDGDLRQANYSSLRAGLVSFRQRVEQIQFHTVIPQMLTPIWERATTTAVLLGELIAPDFEDAVADYLSVEFYPPALPWVDPKKDSEAVAIEIASGLKSRRQAVAERGYDIETLDAEIAADRARETSLGLDFQNNKKVEAENASA